MFLWFLIFGVPIYRDCVLVAKYLKLIIMEISGISENRAPVFQEMHVSLPVLLR